MCHTDMGPHHHPWRYVERMIRQTCADILFVTRENRTIVVHVVYVFLDPRRDWDLLRFIYRTEAGSVEHVRWCAPAVSASLQQFRSLVDDDSDSDHSPPDATLLYILELSAKEHTGSGGYRDCPFLDFLERVLQCPREASRVTFSTIHGAKGAEHDHVVLFQYNLIGTGWQDPHPGCHIQKKCNTLTSAGTQSSVHCPDAYPCTDAVYDVTIQPNPDPKP